MLRIKHTTRKQHASNQNNKSKQLKKHNNKNKKKQIPQQNKKRSFFSSVPLGPSDPILGISERYRQDPRKEKISLVVGAYRDEDGKPAPLKSVKAAEALLPTLYNEMEYAPIAGTAQFNQLSAELIYGKDHPVLKAKRVANLQSLSGTGALRVLGGLMKSFPLKKGNNNADIMVSNPTWATHHNIFQHAGLTTGTYRYWDNKNKCLDFNGLIEDLNNMDEGTGVILHAIAHNPTGVDPTYQQWDDIAKVIKKKKLFPIFDVAYLGYASGSIEKDRSAINIFLDNDINNMAITLSFSKNFGLYGHRTGLLSILCQDDNEATNVESQIKILARGLWSNPPIHGSRIVETILNNKELTQIWHNDLQHMSTRIKKMRILLHDELKNVGSTLNWDHIIEQVGMFAYTGMNQQHCERLRDEYAIYLTMNGRISIASINEHNVKRIAEAMHNVTKQ